MDRTRRIVITLISFLFVVTSSLTHASVHHSGATLGQFEVGGSGGATYSVPLAIPPGIAGMQPSLSLVYNSQAGNGSLGMGWSLGGLSVVHRCPATLVQDGYKGGISYTDTDKLCIDGQRLVAINGVYGANGTEYRTEKDSYSRIISYGIVGSGPARFEVETKGGQRMEYGNTGNSAIEAQGKTDIAVWAVNKISDTAGNYLTVTYDDTNVVTNGEYYPESIDYTGNTNAAMTPTMSVRFYYETRPDISPLYSAGSLIKNTQRMTNIQTYVNAVMVRDYRLSYVTGTVTGRSRLTSLQEYDAGSECKSPSNFQWQEGGDGDGSFQAETVPLPTGDFDRSYVWSGDYNGDGRTDILTYYSGKLSTFFANGDGSFQVETVPIPTSDFDRAYIWSGDYNGDGLTDILTYYEGKLSTLFANGDGSFQAETVPIPTSDFDRAYVWSGDYNGDGLADILTYYVGQLSTLFANGDGSFQAETVPLPTGAFDRAYIWSGDYNGDGLTDILTYYEGQLSTLFANGDGGFQAETVPLPTGAFDRAYVWSGDYNGDGRTDILTYYIGQLSTLFANGDGSFQAETVPLPTGAFDRAYIWSGDYNGDGLTDILTYYEGQLSTLFANGVTPDLLTTITNGLNDVTSITYKPLTDSSVYTKGSGAPYPEIDIQAPMYVVSHYETDNGIGGTYGFDYTYGEAKAHVTGRGFLGFGYMETTDTNTSIVTRTEYNQTFPTNGLADKIEVRLSDSTLIEQTTNTWQSSSDDDPDNDQETQGELFTISLQSTTRTTNELDGTQISSVSTSNTYDNYGNVTQIVVATDGGVASGGSTKTTVNTYTNDTANWYLGRLTRATVTSETPTDTATRVSAFDYEFGTTGLLKKEIIEPDLVDYKLITEYGYDSYGHKISVTVSGDAGATDPIVARTTTTSYDYTNLATDGTYTTLTTNALNHKEAKMIDARFGVVVMLVGPNSNYDFISPLELANPPDLATTWQYDTLGRKTKENRADDTYTTISYDHCDATIPCLPTYAALKVTKQVASTIAGTTPLPGSITYFDMLGREVRSEGVGFDGTAVYKDTEYNNRGKVDKVSIPYFTGGTVHWTSYQYDVLGRVTQETRPDTSIVTRTYIMTASGHQTTERIQHSGDGIDQSTTKLNNALGQLIKVTDNATGTIDYTYDAFGNLLTTTDPVGNVVTMTYDTRGRKTAMDDPDMGHWAYTHNVLGELVKQKDAKYNIVIMEYDVLGRMVSRTEPEGTSTWEYDIGFKAIGKLDKVVGLNNFQKTLHYDANGLHWKTTTDFNTTASAEISKVFDAYSRVAELHYPNGMSTKHIYNAQGFLSEVRDFSNNNLYWQANDANALGQTIMETFGNGIETIRSYDDKTGRMTGISSAVGINEAAQLLAYEYDALGNLKTRQDAKRDLTEDFTYDNLNRLTGVTLNTVQGTTYQYDSIGNITNKSDVGSYTYGENGAGPHAVTTAGSNTYTYDANGNQISGGGRAVVGYTSYNKVGGVIKGSAIRQFSYAPDRGRFYQYHWDGTKGTTTWYLGNLYEKIEKTNSAVTEYKYYIFAGKQRVAIYTSRSDTTSNMRYIHTDHLGSIDTITKEDGSVEESLSYDAFGKRRNAGDWSVLSGLLAVMNTNRGFTGHEHLDDVGLIHMNGRVYDPTLGRFLSADPFVQAPKNTQSLNRYSYTLNNPLSYTDPSGNFFFGIGALIAATIGGTAAVIAAIIAPELVKPILSITAMFMSGGIVGISSIASGAVGGFVSGGIMGGNLKSALAGGVTGAAFGWAGGLGDKASSSIFNLKNAESMLAHGVIGGASSELQGGKFANGFVAQMFSKAVTIKTRGMQRLDKIGRGIIATVAGGVANELGGGKFKNGATTAAMGYLFNELTQTTGKGVATLDENGNPIVDTVQAGTTSIVYQETEFAPQTVTIPKSGLDVALDIFGLVNTEVITRTYVQDYILLQDRQKFTYFTNYSDTETGYIGGRANSVFRPVGDPYLGAKLGQPRLTGITSCSAGTCTSTNR